MEKGENAGNQHFLLCTQWFLFCQIQILHFVAILNLLLAKLLSIWTRITLCGEEQKPNLYLFCQAGFQPVFNLFQPYFMNLWSYLHTDSCKLEQSMIDRKCISWCWGFQPHLKHYSIYIAADKVPIHAFLQFLLFLPPTIFSPSHSM